MKQSYCVGEKGYANDKETYTRVLPATKQIKPKPAEAFEEPEKPDITEIIAKEEKKFKKQESSSESSSSSSSESEVSEDEAVVEDDEERKRQIDEELANEKEKRMFGIIKTLLILSL